MVVFCTGEVCKNDVASGGPSERLDEGRLGDRGVTWGRTEPGEPAAGGNKPPNGPIGERSQRAAKRRDSKIFPEGKSNVVKANALTIKLPCPPQGHGHSRGHFHRIHEYLNMVVKRFPSFLMFLLTAKCIEKGMLEHINHTLNGQLQLDIRRTEEFRMVLFQ